MNCKDVSLKEALDHGRTREVDFVEQRVEGETVFFKDGTAIQLTHQDGYDLSEATYEDGFPIIRIGTV